MLPTTSKKLDEFLGTIHHFSSGVYIKEMKLPQNHFVVTHKHSYDHFGLLGNGRVIVEVDGEKKEHIGPCVIEIKAGIKHQITAIDNVVWFCIHATDVADPNKIDHTLIEGN